MKLDIGNGEIELEASFYTLIVYEQQFGGDMVGELFGEEGHASPISVSDTGDVVIDYKGFNWTAAAKAMWACAKCATPNMPTYESWMRSMTDVDMWNLIGEFIPYVRQALFRAGDGDPEQNAE